MVGVWGVRFPRVHKGVHKGVDEDGHEVYFFVGEVGEVGEGFLESYLGRVGAGLLVVPEPIYFFAVDVGQGFEGGCYGLSLPGFISLEVVPRDFCEVRGLFLGYAGLRPCLF